jgi:release factor glutamine methyltransferase
MATPPVAELLKAAARRLGSSATPALDAELLLAAALGRDRTWLRTWPEYEPVPDAVSRFDALLQRREQGEPMAHILGRRGFWTLDLQVSPATLIPRPDTELLVETALALIANAALPVLDMGTGTGAVALALASERPGWAVTAVDVSADALVVAETNRVGHGLKNVQILQSDWFSALPGRRFGLIVSNPPYIAEQDHHLDEGDVRFEPRLALTSGPDGLDAIRHIVYKAPEYLQTPGWLAFEHGFDQGEACRALLRERGFEAVASHRDLGGQERVTLGRWPC